MSTHALVGYFEAEDKVLEATRAARHAGYNVHDVYTPYAVHGMDEAMGLAPSKLTFVCLGAGLLGLACALGLQVYASAIAWPINIGGKPHLSFPAFMPVAFELTVLFAALISVGALLMWTRVGPGSKRVAPPRVTDDRFVIALRAEGDAFDADQASSLMKKHGAVDTGFLEVP